MWKYGISISFGSGLPDAVAHGEDVAAAFDRPTAAKC